jgi:hypothetical protein
MSDFRITSEGRTWIGIEDAAGCYGIAVERIEVWIGEGLLPAPRVLEGHRALEESVLDRIATLVRLSRFAGEDPLILRILLDD